MFEHGDVELSYCEGDLDPGEIDWTEVARLEDLITKIDEHPDEDHRNLASVGVLHEMYGSDLEVR